VQTTNQPLDLRQVSVIQDNFSQSKATPSDGCFSKVLAAKKKTKKPEPALVPVRAYLPNIGLAALAVDVD